MTGGLPELDVPVGWCTATLRDLVSLLQYGLSLRSDDDKKGGLPFLRMGNIQSARLDLSHLKYVPRAAGLSDFRLVRGDILFNRTNSPELVGKAAVFDWAEEAVFASYLIRLRALPDAVEPRYLCWWLNSPWGRRWASLVRTDGVSQSNINGTKLNSMPVPLPPLREQKRIVARIEELLANLTAARDHLAKVPLILKRFRQSVLAAACTGKLSEDWRDSRHDTVAAVTLLELIREARLRAWKAAERRKLALRGRAITEAELRARYRKPDEAEAAFTTPESWAWATLDELTLLAGGLTKGQKRRSGARLRSVPYLRVANVQRGHLDLTLVKDILATEDEITDLRLERGDILFNEGGDIDKLGRGWVWDAEIAECIHQNHVFRARPASKLVEPQFVSHYANTFGQRFFFDAGAQTVNLASVNMSKIRGLPVPVPPVDEQREILRRVKALLGLADTIERRVAGASARADALTQAIIAKAFRGELVPTEAEVARVEGREYESGGALLARVRTKRGERVQQRSVRPHPLAASARVRRSRH